MTLTVLPVYPYRACASQVGLNLERGRRAIRVEQVLPTQSMRFPLASVGLSYMCVDSFQRMKDRTFLSNQFSFSKDFLRFYLFILSILKSLYNMMFFKEEAMRKKKQKI